LAKVVQLLEKQNPRVKTTIEGTLQP